MAENPRFPPWEITGGEGIDPESNLGSLELLYREYVKTGTSPEMSSAFRAELERLRKVWRRYLADGTGVEVSEDNLRRVAAMNVGLRQKPKNQSMKRE